MPILTCFEPKTTYMRGLVAGVRTLLAKSACFTWDSVMVTEHEPVRRTHKALLSDLAVLVKAAKHLQDVLAAQNIHFELDCLTKGLAWQEKSPW
jgi:hypothetical protein